MSDSNETLMDLDLPKHGPWSRRGILAAAGLAGMSAMCLGLLTSSASATEVQAAALTGGPTDGGTQFASIPGRNINEKILNFALTLEILEADLYRQALNIASGKPIGAALESNPGSYRRTVGTGGLDGGLAVAGFAYLVQFAYVEAAHRDFLKSAIAGGGGTPVTRNPGGYRFPTSFSKDLRGLLGVILPLEETGVRAYLGALPYFTDLGLATVAGGIYSTEARHSAVINGNLGRDYGPARRAGDLTVTPNPPANNTFEYYLKPKTVLTAASAYFA